MGRFTQFKVLTTKSAILAIRNWKGSLGQLVAPLIIMLLMLMFQLIINHLLATQEMEFTPYNPIGVVPKCVPPLHSNCTTIVFAPNTTETYDLMIKVAEKNNLNFGEDVVPLINYTGRKEKSDYQELSQYYLNNPNQTTLGIFFSGVYNPRSSLPLASYVINFNNTAPNGYNLELKRTLDESIMEYYGIDNVSFSIGWQKFPEAQSRISSFDIVAAAGAQWFYVPPMVTFFLLLSEIVTEKEQRLRLGMRMMGLNDGVYWTVWFLTGLIFVFLSTLVLQFSGMACQFNFFTNSNFFAIFLVFFLFGISMYMIAFFISTLVNTLATAQTIGYIIILIGFVFQAILTAGYGILIRLMYSQSQNWITLLKWLLLFYPPFNLACAFFDISTLSSETFSFTNGTMVQGPGFYFSNLFDKNTEYVKINNSTLDLSVPACYVSLVWLVIDCIVFGVLTWYFDNVLPGEHGSPRPPYFFLTREYWGIPQKNKQIFQQVVEEAHSKTDSDVERETKQVYERGDDESVAVKIVGLCKTYRTGILSYFKKDGGQVKALQGLNLMIENGELFCLLGHNGAGKTTTINILTGLFGSSSGQASIYGLDVDTEISEIRKVTGVCPQHDILWNELTAREHLRLFARLKDIDKGSIEEAVQEKLEQMGLEKVGDNRAGTFSGGMKRRLSVAISAIGNPKIIFMDEPTTGMDPVNRRAVWQMIQDLKKDRVILLTTHAMEEADVLGDRIGIMAYGKLRCLGNSLHLKNKYGAGYRIDLVSQNPHGLRDYISQHYPFATLNSFDGGCLVYNIPREHQSDGLIGILRFFEDKNLSGHLVQEWNVAHSSLEEVFLEISKMHQFVYTDPEETVEDLEEDPNKTEDDKQNTYPLDNTSKIDINMTEKKPNPKSHPYRALMRKNLSLQKRQWCTNCCQIATPLYVLLIMLILQLIIRSKLDGNIYQTKLEVAPPYGLNSDFVYFAQFPPFLTIPNITNITTSADQSISMNLWKSDDGLGFDDIFNYFPPPYYSRDEGCYSFCQFITFPMRIVKAAHLYDPPITPHPTGQCLVYGLYVTPDSEATGNLDPLGTNQTGLLGKIVQKNCTLADRTVIQVPHFNQSANNNAMAATLLQDQNEMNQVPVQNITKPPSLYLIPDASVLFNEVVANQSLNYTIAVNDNIIILYHRANFITRTNVNVSQSFPNVSSTDILIPGLGRLAVMDWINWGFYAWSKNITNPTSYDNRQAFSRWVQQMPYKAISNLLDIVEYFGMTLYPIALSLQLPIYIYILVLEKADKLREMMKCMGMRRLPYFATNYLFFYTLYTLAVLLFWIGGYLIGQRFFTQTGISTLFIFFFGWGHALIALAYLLASFLNSKRAASVVGYAVALIGTLIAEVVCDFMYAEGTDQSISNTLPTPFLIYPQFTFTRGIYLMNYACTLQQCYGEIGSFAGNELEGVMIALYLNAVVYLLIALYLDEVLPREFGVPREPLFLIRPLIDFIKSNFSSKKNNDQEEEEKEEDLLLTSREDRDCFTERKRIEEGKYPQDCPLVIKNLRKEYPAKPRKKIAVVDLCLAIEKGECFGLLGENGAGKTTTISMLTGIFPPTSGTAWVGGFNIVRDIDRAHLMMGVCPQFNILWDDLTVEEHILFYARLKGIPISDESQHLESALVQVGLYQVRDRYSKNLSGGMKRRLSVAISLVGNSAVVFLDEPTTGLDPSSRRQLWKILQRSKKGRAIVLTTHAMDEAELLCNRIGILALGQMRCLGTSTHLRNNVSSGYRLQINYDPEKERVACEFVESVFPGCELVSRFRGTSKFLLTHPGVSVADGFAQLIESSCDYGITDFAFSQFGLEDVFQKIVDRSHREEEREEEI